jgi:hypothetical protein|nr:MAG TPA_asm: hypothetical protein [Caudoviricetes sp.]
MRKKRIRDGQVFTTEQLSPHKERTPEGYLLCKDVPISRVGDFEYTPTEAGIRGKGGKVILTRTPEELFRPETIASFEGKPVVFGHDRFADPANWREITVGIVKNVRQGEGSERGLLLADLLLTDKKGIDMVESGSLREVSCGYDSMTVDDGEGRGHQEGIVGNHVALVSRARCGSVCSVRDGFMTKGNLKTMLRRLFRDGEEDKFNEALDGLEVKECGDEGETTPPPAPQPTAEEVLKTLAAQVAELVKRVEAIESAKVADQDDQPPATTEPVVDEEAQVVPDEEAQQVIADAEEIAPGMQKPACDSADGHFTRGLIRRVQRNALKIAGVQKFGDTASMTGQVLDIAFKAAVDAHRAGRNPTPRIGDGDTQPQPESLNERFKKFWNQ